MTRCIFIALLLLAGCAQNPERSAIRKANSLMKEGRLQEAMDIVENYLDQHPDAVEVLRVRVFILLKAGRGDMAALEVKRLPSGDPVLRQALRHRDPTIRANTAKIISDDPTSVSFQALTDRLDDPDAFVRRYCVHALGELKNPQALRPLFRLLHDQDWYVRAEAATALAKIGDPRAAGWIVYLLGDRDGFVQYSAMRALQQLACESNRTLLLEALEKGNANWQFGIGFALAKLHEPAGLQPLLTGVVNTNADIRQCAAEALSNYNSPGATNALAKLLKDTEPLVREEASRSLRKLQGKAAPKETVF